MNWLALSLIPPFLFSLSNFIDEYLVKNHFTNKPILFLMIACTLEIIPAIGFVSFYEPALDVEWMSRLKLMFLSVLATLSIAPYLMALQRDGAGIVVPFFQLIPVFVFILGWIFLGEVISTQKIVGGLLIVSAAFVMSWDFKTRQIPLVSAFYMLIASLGIAIFVVGIRDEMETIGWLAATTWVWMGNSVFSIIALSLYKPWRTDFMAVFKASSWRVSSLFVGQAILDNVAGVIYIAALAIAPAAVLVQVLGGVQPLYILILTIFMGLLLPQYFPKIAINRVFLYRIMCTMVLFAGLALLLMD